jgi:hypothetical protein
MNRTSSLIAAAAVVLAGICGCGGPDEPFTTGFLSDYSKLQRVSDTSCRYINKAAAAKYTAFIVDPVVVHFQEGGKAIVTKSEGKLTEQDMMDLTNYFHDAIIKAITDAGYPVVYQPRYNVARIRVAITDLDETNVALAAIPQTRVISGAGVGGAAMEAEVVNSMTGQQIAAVVESKAGSRMPFTGLSDWGGAKSAMDEWAKRLKERLDEAKGK